MSVFPFNLNSVRIEACFNVSNDKLNFKIPNKRIGIQKYDYYTAILNKIAINIQLSVFQLLRQLFSTVFNGFFTDIPKYLRVK